jgi:hypothetical protein
MLGAYNTGVPLGGRTDKDFYKQYKKELDVWCNDLKDITYKLEKVSGFWNPIRARKGL